MEYLHSEPVSVCHRDTNPNNVMVTPLDLLGSGGLGSGNFVTTSDEVRVTLIDFNVSRRFREKKGFQLGVELTSPESTATKRLLMLTQTGAASYTAPELSLGHSYTEKVDLWGVGCVLYNAIFGDIPFP